jgi:hypothetical protein
MVLTSRQATYKQTALVQLQGMHELSRVRTPQLVGKLVQEAGERHDAGADHVRGCAHEAPQHHLKQHCQATLLPARSIAC